MFSINLHTVVNDMVEHLLVEEGGRDNEALHFHLDLRMSYFYDRKNHSTSRGLHLLYQCPPGHTYISVFSGITKSPFGKINEVESWKHEGTHDSCWRDVSSINKLFFEIANEVISKFPKDMSLCANDLSECNNFAMFGKLFDWVPCEVKMDPTDENKHRRMIVLK